MDTIGELKQYVDEALAGMREQIKTLHQRTRDTDRSVRGGDAQIVQLIDDLQEQINHRFEGAHTRMDAITEQGEKNEQHLLEVKQQNAQNTTLLNDLLTIMRGNIGRAAGGNSEQ